MQLQFLDYTVLIVAELDRSIDFYVNLLGLPLNHRSGGYAQLRTGSTRLSLFTREALERTLRKPLQAPSEDAPGFEIAFLVENVDEAFDELVARAPAPSRLRWIASGGSAPPTCAIPTAISSSSPRISAESELSFR